MLVNTRAIDSCSFYCFQKDKLVKLCNRNLVSLYDIRYLNYTALINSYLNFMSMIPAKESIIYKRDYIENLFEKWRELEVVQAYLNSLGEFDSKDLLAYWVNVGLLNICGSGYIFNSFEPFAEKTDLVNRIKLLLS